MENRVKLGRFLRSNNGGIGEIIAIVVSIVLVLGLIAYAILGQVAGTKSAADKASNDQNIVNRMLQEGDVVTGSIVKNNYLGNPVQGITVTVCQSDGTTVIGSSAITDTMLFKMTKTYTNGAVTAIKFTLSN